MAKFTCDGITCHDRLWLLIYQQMKMIPRPASVNPFSSRDVILDRVDSSNSQTVICNSCHIGLWILDSADHTRAASLSQQLLEPRG